MPIDIGSGSAKKALAAAERLELGMRQRLELGMRQRVLARPAAYNAGG
jgi:hypothetical protein